MKGLGLRMILPHSVSPTSLGNMLRWHLLTLIDQGQASGDTC